MCSKDPLPNESDESFLRPADGPAEKVLNLERYTTYFFTAIANQLSTGASRAYLQRFGIGIVEWRVMAMLAIEPGATATRICDVIGLDKGAVSKAVGSLRAKGHLASRAAGHRERRRHLELTAAGYALHDRIIDIALDREKRLLRGFDPEEVDALVGFLGRILANAPDMNAADDDDAVPEEAREAPAPRQPARRTARRATR